jgi:hypothetical protein
MILQVAGDDAKRLYETYGYTESIKVITAIYFGTLPILAAAAFRVTWRF